MFRGKNTSSFKSKSAMLSLSNKLVGMITGPDIYVSLSSTTVANNVVGFAVSCPIISGINAGCDLSTSNCGKSK